MASVQPSLDAAVIIVGAGMAGLAAARTLVDADVDVVVVEGRDRIGGRLHTVDLGDGLTCDLGGSWIHGVTGNPMTGLAETTGVTGHITAWNTDPRHSMIIRPDGTALDPEPFARGAAAFWEQMDDLSAGLAADDERTMADGLNEGVLSAAELSPSERQGFDWAAQIGVQSMEADDIDRVSLAGTVVDERPGGDLLLTGGGYRPLVDHVARDLDIRTGCPVQAIRRRTTGWAVETSAETLSAEAVIVTVPLSVLQDRVIDFDPPLPDHALAAIDGFGFGVAEKLVLRFAEEPWPHEVTSLSVIDAADDDPFCSWTFLPERPVAFSYAGGSRGRAMSRQGDDEVLRRGLERLTAAFGPLPDVVTWHRTNWLRDPFARGAYSYAVAPSAPEDRLLFQQAIHPGLRLAGAGLADHYATADGAYASGVAAAEQTMAGIEISRT